MLPLSGLPWHCVVPSTAMLATISAAALLVGCSVEEPMQPKTMNAALQADFELVSSARIYFGHQSVGGNIMDGLADLQAQLGRSVIRVGELGSLDIGDGRGVLLHTTVGENAKPGSKCDDFRQILDQKLRGSIDVALFKFCYVDFDDMSDVDAIFTTYSRTMDGLKLRYPDVIFVHVTAPLRSIEVGPGVWVREMLGRPNRSKLANFRRNEFNRRLMDRYAGEPVFDLAGVMSTYPDGRRETFTADGTTAQYSLVPAYTDDGGHLNAVGRTHVAAELIHSLAVALREAKRANLQADLSGGQAS